MLYIVGSTRPDISYEVHQYARFSRDTKNSHEIGLNRIARYLKLNRTKGLIMKPYVKNLNLDLFADVDFVGLFAAENKQNPVSVKSRTGLLLNFGGVTIY